MIDTPVVMVVVGAAIQAVQPARNILAHIRRRPNATEFTRALPFTPLPLANRALEQLIEDADAALDARR